MSNLRLLDLVPAAETMPESQSQTAVHKSVEIYKYKYASGKGCIEGTNDGNEQYAGRIIRAFPGVHCQSSIDNFAFGTGTTRVE